MACLCYSAQQVHLPASVDRGTVFGTTTVGGGTPNKVMQMIMMEGNLHINVNEQEYIRDKRVLPHTPIVNGILYS